MDLPPGGAEAISPEDLRRDVGRLSREPPDAVFLERLGQMQFPASEPVSPGATCASRAGGAGAALTVTASLPASPAEATGAAALISIARAWDLDGGPPGPRTLCLLPPGVDSPAGAFRVGALASGVVRMEPAGAHADAADATLPAERIVYSEVQARVRAIYPTLSSLTTPAPMPPVP